MEPKRQVDLLLLSVLATGPSHGYGVIERVRGRSAAVTADHDRNLYPALHRLEHAGLVASRRSTGLRRRRVYRLTRKGRTRLERELTEWELLARAVARAA